MSEHENPLRAEKRKKLKSLRDNGIDPFPHNFKKDAQTSKIKTDFDRLAMGESDTQVFTLAGRLMTLRDMGKAAFFNLQDESGQIQVYVRLEELGEADRTAFSLVDIGDIIGIKGFPFRTKKGELSVHIKEFKILCKTLEPLPEKYHGLTDVELKYRNRHLDLIMNPEAREVFLKRSKIVQAFRDFLTERGFLEVETPLLQPIYGGAAAKPFTTHHNALDMRLYLRISPELYLKRLIVGGFEKVFDLNRNFRNEGIDRSHNPEFTMLEYYEAYTDYFDQMKQFEEIIAYVAKAVNGTTESEYQGQKINFAPPWKRISIHAAIREIGGFEFENLADADFFVKLKTAGSELKPGATRAMMIMEAFDLFVEKKIVQPTFITDFPVEVSPLTKSHRQIKGLVERFEPICCGMEIGNSYTELNDPEEQLSRLKEQESQRVINEEAHPLDEDFMHAIDVGMPPTGGVGIGIERIVMLLTNQPSIRDILLFPTMRPQQR